MNMKHVFNDHVMPDMSFLQFGNLCGSCWNEDYGFLVIDKECAINDGRNRKGFDKFASI